MGGRAAEKIMYRQNITDITSSSYLSKATKLAKEVVTKHDFSKLGLMSCDDTTVSLETKFIVEKETKRLIEKAYRNARRIISSHKKELELLASVLMEKERLT
ncbi:hypothetical protein TSUD_315560 [Trifolium subterraneum]|uniref:Peptidase M41 domain-containing protein n=1 Tax=Trifolium subterraneum TaxID=3900 RepID=A0A2Z6MF31_TRISU|nr:hypothetical protein TSUD_315560 [Trifolium subterraneum]